MPYKDKEKQREYQKGWYQRKKLGLPTRTTVKLSDNERKERHKLYRKRWRTNVQKRAEVLLGSSCKICGNNIRKLSYHRKSGEEHSTTFTSALVVKSPEEYIRLCEWCHRGIHFLMNILKWNWNQIENLIRENDIEI